MSAHPNRFQACFLLYITISVVNSYSHTGYSASGVVDQCNESLKNLQVSSIDILYLHWPDHNTPIEDTLKGIDQLYKGIYALRGVDQLYKGI